MPEKNRSYAKFKCQVGNLLTGSGSGDQDLLALQLEVHVVVGCRKWRGTLELTLEECVARQRPNRAIKLKSALRNKNSKNRLGAASRVQSPQNAYVEGFFSLLTYNRKVTL